MKNLRSLFLVFSLAAAAALNGAEPTGYYNSCEGKGGQALLKALAAKVGPHTDRGYDALLTLYRTSDAYPDGTIWDMYSTKHWSYGTTCGNYKLVGDCYNREHSFPKSWFNNTAPMKSDAFHIYPTDGKVNGQRSNFPYGECAQGTYLPANGNVRPLGKLGVSTFPGYTGKVFEPDDEYKGDFARSYFYMAAAYNERVATWNSDMLAQNNYPVFSSWAISLLLKWNSQDPVSQKEIDRNEAVAEFQGNRNPFIDHPELADYIWGDKKSLQWSASGQVEAAVNRPVDGSVFDLGATVPGHGIAKTLDLLTTNATQAVSVTVSGAGFSVSPASVSASTANGGTTLHVSFEATAVGDYTGTLTAACGEAVSTVTLTSRVIDGLPIGAASFVTDESFEISWTYIGDDTDGKYTLEVSDDLGLLDGYPRQVVATDRHCVVGDLMPSTDYEVLLRSANYVSERISVRTSDPVRAVEFYFDGDLHFTADPGQPSEAAEIMVDLHNIDENYTLRVEWPFEISVDRFNWDTSLTLSPDVDRFYMRLNSPREGQFETEITVTAGDFFDDSTVVSGEVSSSPDFFEDFEHEGTYSTYSAQDVEGNGARWKFSDCGIWPNNDPVHSGNRAVRFGKTADSYIAMDEDRARGIGTVSFYARTFNNDPAATLEVQYSTDGGASWQTAGSVTVNEGTYTEHTVAVNRSGRTRLRLQQIDGKRFLLDDVAMTSAPTSGIADPGAERHQWDAYALDGLLTVTVADDRAVTVYHLDGTAVVNRVLAAGTHTFAVEPGLYIVVSGDFARRVLIP